jgi:hypothetical protein
MCETVGLQEYGDEAFVGRLPLSVDSSSVSGAPTAHERF